MTDKGWIDKNMNQPERSIEDLSESEIKHCAYRWLKIDNACSAMGGFANFRHWINRHAVNYFNSLKPLEAENTELRKILNDFLTTEVCSRTWIDEMRATIDDVLNGDKDE